jgi:hypothetical protein
LVQFSHGGIFSAKKSHQTDLKDLFKCGEKGPGNRIGTHATNTNRAEPRKSALVWPSGGKDFEQMFTNKRKKLTGWWGCEPVSPASLSLRLMNLLPPPASTASHTPIAVTATSSDASARHHGSFVISLSLCPPPPLGRGRGRRSWEGIATDAKNSSSGTTVKTQT